MNSRMISMATILLVCVLVAPVLSQPENSMTATKNKDDTSITKLLKRYIRERNDIQNRIISFLMQGKHKNEAGSRIHREHSNSHRIIQRFMRSVGSKTNKNVTSKNSDVAKVFQRFMRSTGMKNKINNKSLSQIRNKRQINFGQLDPATLAILTQFLQDKLQNGTGTLQMRYGRSI